jgi:hypothetical protein
MRYKVYIYIHIHIYIYIHMCIYIYIYMCVCTLCTLLIFIDPHFEMGKLMIDSNWNWTGDIPIYSHFGVLV